MYRTILLVTGLLIALVQTACVSMSSLQTAETLEKGKNQVTFGGGYYSSEETVQADETKFKAPYLETSYREGLAENLDAGLKFTLIGSVTADAKYRFFDGAKFDMAVGGALGYTSFSSGSGETEVKTTFYDLNIPLYMSYRVAEPFAVYATPRYVLRVSQHSGPESESAGSSLLGGAAGFKIGKDWGVYLEAGYQKDLRSNFDMMQYNLSFFWSRPESILAGASDALSSASGIFTGMSR